MTEASLNQKVSWNELNDFAEKQLRTFMSADEPTFVKKAWTKIIKSGLANYTNHFEEIIVKLRFISLADLYLDYCKVTHEEDHESDYYEWIDILELDEITIGRIYQSILKPEDQEMDELDKSKAVQYLSIHFRPEIYKSLMKGFGSESLVFLHLWRSTHNNKNEESDDEVLNDATLEKLATFEWISNGCEVLRFF